MIGFLGSILFFKIFHLKNNTVKEVESKVEEMDSNDFLYTNLYSICMF